MAERFVGFRRGRAETGDAIRAQTRTGAVPCARLGYFFLMVSTTVVFGRRLAS